MGKPRQPSGGDPSAAATQPPAIDPIPPANSEALRQDGPTLKEWVAAGYKEEHYPPEGYAPRADADDPAATAGDELDDQAPAAALDDADASNYEATLLETLPPAERDLPGALLFAEACVVFGIDPGPFVRPVQILREGVGPRFKFYKGDPYLTPPTPDRVKFVTAGGVKVCHPIDQDFENILRRWFHTAKIDNRTREVVEGPLPDDLTLPREAVTGVPMQVEHRHPEGYLRRRALQAARRG